MHTIHVARDGFEAAAAALRRTALQDSSGVEKVAREIIAHVRARGDEALLELGRKFDCPELASLEVTENEWDAACDVVSPADRQAVAIAAENIIGFHRRQLRTSWLDAKPGSITGQLIRPLQRVGVYVPGGTAVYPSSVLMAALPAMVAGVPELVVCTPCGRDGSVPPLVLYAARIAGVSRVFKAGGAQAIAALAFGTETIPAVDKIVGPGNQYVIAAKRLLWGQVDIDMLAGPSEVCVIADEGANPGYAVADLLTQAEHDTECAAYLITPSASFAETAALEIDSQLERLPRSEIVRGALADHGAIVVTESLQQAIELANICAPEHLALMVRDPFSWLGAIRNAGAILMGDYSPQTLGDYAAGPSHTLPTSGTARFASPLHVDTFLKKSSFIYYTPAALEAVAPALKRFAEVEGFAAHASAVTARENIPEEEMDSR